METEGFETFLVTTANAVCEEWGYAAPSPDWLERALQRLPKGLGEIIVDGVSRQRIILEGGRFTLAALPPGKGPYAFFSRSQKGEPAPNWEYFVQVAAFLKYEEALAPHGFTVNFEDDLMDISVSQGGSLIWCIEVKERARDLDPLLTGISSYGQAFDADAPDRGNDPLRKAKYLVRRRPPYFSLVALGKRLDFGVQYDGESFVLAPDVVPLPV